MNTTEIIMMFIACIPSAIVGFGVWALQRKVTKSAARQEELEKAREKNELHIIETLGASLALGEATARAVQRIPDAHCNGDMHKALDYAERVKHEQKDFLTEQAIHGLY